MQTRGAKWAATVVSANTAGGGVCIGCLRSFRRVYRTVTFSFRRWLNEDFREAEVEGG